MTDPMSFEREWRELLEAVEKSLSPEAPTLALPPERRMPLSRIALLALLEEVRDEWRGLRRRVEADPETAERFVNAAWTLKELLAHMASWAVEFRREVETVHEGERFDYAIPYAMGVFGPTEWNEVEVRKRDEATLEAIFDEYAQESERLEDLVVRVNDAVLYGAQTFPLAPSGDPEALLQGPTAFIVFAKCIHDLHHIAQIKSRLPRLTS